MTYTLLMRLTGPMQAWGLQSRFSIRDTAREPTMSGVVGLVCAALGRPREDPLDDLAALRLGVRVDREGAVRRDYHTAMDVVKASAKIKPGKPISEAYLKETEPSERFYLADAWFIVGLESDDRALLERIDAALAKPRWPLALGRKAFTPGLPVHIAAKGRPCGIVEAPLVDALVGFRDPHEQAPKVDSRTRFVVDGHAATDRLEVVAERMQPDVPVSFLTRQFLPRRVVVGYYSYENHVSQ
jgi:CRISPR system Cascade subunit CasD